MAVPRLRSLGCVILVVAFTHMGRPAPAQSLVDAARLARATRAELGPPTKVYTNEDLSDTGRITEPTLAWAARYRSQLLEAALERERALLELLRARPVMLPAPAPPTFGFPLYPIYSSYPGYPVFLASSANPRPRQSTKGSAAPRGHQHRRGSRARDERSRIQTARHRAASGRRVDPSTRRPAARSGYEESSRPFPYIAPGLPAPGLARNRNLGSAQE